MELSAYQRKILNGFVFYSSFYALEYPLLSKVINFDFKYSEKAEEFGQKLG